MKPDDLIPPRARSAPPRPAPVAGLRPAGAFTLIEMLVYMTVLVILVSVGYAAFYSCMNNSRALRRNADDIVGAVHAGENWRADVRAVTGSIGLETNAVEQILRLPGTRGEVSYLVSTNALFRRLGNNDWSRVLDNVAASSFVADPRPGVAAWRWELELQARQGKAGRIRPLFTFIAVPSQTPAK